MARKTHIDPRLMEILSNIEFNEEDNLNNEPADENAAHRLRTLYERLSNGKERGLQLGQLATWKPGLKNRRCPAYGHPAVVIERLTAPLTDHTEDSGYTYYREPLDIVLGVLHADGDFLIYHFDSRRFQPYEIE